MRRGGPLREKRKGDRKGSWKGKCGGLPFSWEGMEGHPAPAHYEGAPSDIVCVVAVLPLFDVEREPLSSVDEPLERKNR
jgi:hypothetical protein